MNHDGTCTKGLEAGTCELSLPCDTDAILDAGVFVAGEDCEQAGLQLYITSALSCAIQVPLVYLSFKRISAHNDSRFIKNASVPLAAVVVVLSLTSVIL